MWFVVAFLCIGLFFVDLVNDYQQIQIPCEGAWTIDGGCNFLAISSVEADLLSSWGLTMQHYAIAMLSSTIVMTLVYSTLGFLILWRQGGTVIGLTVSLALLTIPFTIYSAEVDWATIHPNLFFPGVIAALLGNFILLIFLYLIPDGRFSPRWAYIPLGIGLLAVTILTIHINDIITLPEAIINVLIITSICLVLLSVALQIYRYFRDSSSEQRQQSKWILIGVAALFSSIFIWIFLFAGALSIPGGQTRLLLNVTGTTVLSALLIMLPVAITFAILRYGLWNIDIVINRSLVYGSILAIAAIIFAIALFGFQLLGSANPLFAGLISIAFTAVLFVPARKRVQHFVDHRIYGLRFGLDEVNQLKSESKPSIETTGQLTGQQFGDFELLDLLGKGGMGEVYKAYHQGETLAIKVLNMDMSTDSDMRRRFEREAAAGMKLQHPNIVRVHEMRQQDAYYYMVMEHIDGQDLRQHLKQEDKLDIETATTIITKLCDALTVAHSQNYVHRDIKPANIMLRSNGDPVLMDFGIAKLRDGRTVITKTGAIGTIDYMAPEQIMEAKEVDARADIYALGVTLYEMLTGERPFKGSPAQVMFAHIQQPAPDIRDLDDSIPRTIAKAIAKALAKKPDDRYQSAEAFANDLLA